MHGQGKLTWKTTVKKNSAATATATTATITPAKCSVLLAIGRTKAQLWIHSGAVRTITKLAKNATACGKPRRKRLSRRKVKVYNWNPVYFGSPKPGGVVVKHRGLWSP